MSALNRFTRVFHCRVSIVGGLIAVAALALASSTRADDNAGSDLAERIAAAKPGAVIAISAGSHGSPIALTQAVTLKGESPESCVIEVTADQPAISINGKGPFVIEGLTIKWQLETSGRNEQPKTAIFAKDANLTLRNCRVIALGNPARSPQAIVCEGFSNVAIENCHVEGFEFAINYSGGAEGAITDSVVAKPGHCGISVFADAKVEIARCIVTGSRFHGLRSTGGTILAHDNLIIKNANRGIYLGNRSALGRVNNNVVLGNGAGISTFAQSEVTVENNVFLDNGYVGVDMRDTCRLNVRNNIFQDNPRGMVVYQESGKPAYTIGANAFWQNETDAENYQLPDDALRVDPKFADAVHGQFEPGADQLAALKMGLTDPKPIAELWKKWEALAKAL